MKVLTVVCRVAGVAALLVGALATVGCGSSYQVAEVNGVLLIRGKPGNKIQIQFIPDIDKGSKGPISTAQTDSQGRFTLQLMEGAAASSRPGAVVGWHRVVLSDLQLAESATGQGVPIRLPPQYTLPGATPLSWEVTPGKQSIQLEVH